MANQLERQVEHYRHWRDDLIHGIEAYQAWLDSSGHIEIQQTLRIYDLAETLRNDRVTLAFVGEYSRGKTELINALFFSNFKQRLLPSDVGRTTMCPTEIFCLPNEAPYIRLLPIETRKRDDSIATLKRTPIEWIKVRLNLDSESEMAEALQHLTHSKTVPMDEARELGLLEESNLEASTVVIVEGDRVAIPAWRHALINYPHPLLKNGLVVLDTPGLNALGTEPELTLSMIPNAHAVLFLLAVDTGVTKSDMEVWQKYIENFVPRRIAVLNKIDLAWDELKSVDQIAAGVERQLADTAAILNLPREHVIAVSAQKALLARIRGDDDLLARSGIGQLEDLLANEIIPAKQEILRSVVSREIGGMIDSAYQSIGRQLESMQVELNALAQLSGKNRNMGRLMLARLEADRAAYQVKMANFKNASNTVNKKGTDLLSALDAQHFDAIIEVSRESIESRWTTVGLARGMQGLFQHFSDQVERITKFSMELRKFIEGTYLRFHKDYGFVQLTPPDLSLETHILYMQKLQRRTEVFCRDPVNVMTEKRFLVRKFYRSLVNEARSVFDRARDDADKWLKGVLTPILLQLRDYETLLNRRVENLHKIKDDIGSLEERGRQLEKLRASLREQSVELVKIKSTLEGKKQAAA